MTPKALARMPQAYRDLTDDQRNGLAYLPDLPEVFWVDDNSTARTQTAPADKPDAVTGWRYFPPNSKNSRARQMLATWKRLATMGYQPTTRENYRAVLTRIERGVCYA